jgi:hypothetical protein
MPNRSALRVAATIALVAAAAAGAGCRSTADQVAYLEELHAEDGSHVRRVRLRPSVFDSVAEFFSTSEASETAGVEYEEIENPAAECHEAIEDVREGTFESTTIAVRAVAILCRVADRDPSPLGRQMALAALARLARDVVRLVPATSEPGKSPEPAAGHVETIIRTHDIGLTPWAHRAEIEGAAFACLDAVRALSRIRFASAPEARAVARLLASVAEFDPDAEIAAAAREGSVAVAGLAISLTVIAALRDPAEEVRAEAARVAGSLRERSFVGPLSTRLSGEGAERAGDVKRTIARSLGVIGDPRAAGALVAAFDGVGPEDESLELQIRLSLAQLTGRSHPDAAAWRAWWKEHGEEFLRSVENGAP